jgi:hypothetical protein
MPLLEEECHRMRRLLIRFAVVFASVFLLVPAVQAQMVGDWDSDLGQFRLEIQRSSSNPAPNWVVARTRHDTAGEVVLEGGITNLVWEGQWYYYEDRPLTGMRRCARRDGLGRPTMVHGRFRVTFNAAEDRFSGIWVACDGMGPERVLQVPFNGARRNTVGAAAPRTVLVPGGGLSSNPDGAGERGPSRPRFEPCDLSVWDLRQYPAFSVMPCKWLAGKGIQINVNAAQSQRPVTVIFEAVEPFRVAGDRIGARPTGVSFRLGLPFRGVPPVGYAYAVTLPGAVCRSDYWLVRLAMSDGTVTDIVGAGASLCGPSRFGDVIGPRIEQIESIEPR